MFKIIEEEDSLPVSSIFVIVYGEPGTGKTSLSFTANNPLLLDFDQGVQRAIGRKKTVKFEKWEDVEVLIKDGHLDRIAPQTVIIDTAGTMLDDYIAGYCMKTNDANKQRGGGLSLKGYGAMKEVFNDFVIRELKLRNIDIIAICHVTEKDSDGIKIARPKVTGGAYDILVSKADLIGFMYADSGRTLLDFSPSHRSIGKNCAGFPTITVKNAITDPGYKTQMADIIQQCKDHMSRQTEAQKDALNKVEEYRDKIENFTAIDDLVSFVEQIEGLPKSIEIQVKQLVANRIKFIFEVEFIEVSDTVSKLDNCLKEISKLPLAMQGEMKTKLNKHSIEKGFSFDKENKKFVKNEASNKSE